MGIALREPRRLGVILPAIVTGFGVLLIAFSAATYLPRPSGMLVPLLLITLVGAAQTSYFSLSRSLMLQSAPEQLRGRVLSFLSLDRAFMTVGAAAAGLLAAYLGVQLAQVLYGVICIVGGIAIFALAPRFRGVLAGVFATRHSGASSS